ncbi:MAG: hypothetical protein HY699_20335 [Deltaproteobacteria bacterium]|nr:hypothetical protein [Deltaproteobacteria bacterium]
MVCYTHTGFGTSFRNTKSAAAELAEGGNIALGQQPLDDCPSFDTDDSSSVTVDELVRAVNNALTGCGGGDSTHAVGRGQ